MGEKRPNVPGRKLGYIGEVGLVFLEVEELSSIAFVLNPGFVGQVARSHVLELVAIKEVLKVRGEQEKSHIGAA